MSLSYDRTVKGWGYSNNFDDESSPLFSVDLPHDEDCKFFETNGIFTLVGTISGCVLIYVNVRDVDTSMIQTVRYVGKVKLSKEKITSIVLG